MCRILISTLFIIIGTVTAFAQGSVKGKVLDKQTDEDRNSAALQVPKESPAAL